jgi:hypothetical protein
MVKSNLVKSFITNIFKYCNNASMNFIHRLIVMIVHWKDTVVILFSKVEISKTSSLPRRIKTEQKNVFFRNKYLLINTKYLAFAS